MKAPLSRRTFLQTTTAAASLGAVATATGAQEPLRIQGFEKAAPDATASVGWKPISDRKIRVGIVGYGVCRFGAEFGFQDHPNVEVIAVSDLLPDRCAALAKACRCAKTYPSLEELVKDERIEAVFVATDAPSHARHCIEVLNHGKHVASAVPAVFGSLEEADALLAAVRSSGRTYMMFETSCYHEDLHAMRQLYRGGHFGQILYSEGEYYHYMSEPIPSYKDWRVGLPPQWYPTHSNAYHLGVTGGRFSEVSCVGLPSRVAHLQANANRYRNPFGTEIALFKTPDGGSSRMAVSWDTPGDSGERGRVRGERGSYYARYEGLASAVPSPKRPPLPPGIEGGGHGGSHGHLTNEFVSAILENRTPLVDITMALNLTVAGIVAHQSAMKNGEWLRIPEYKI